MADVDELWGFVKDWNRLLLFVVFTFVTWVIGAQTNRVTLARVGPGADVLHTPQPHLSTSLKTRREPDVACKMA
jgi:hypothetical protein